MKRSVRRQKMYVLRSIHFDLTSRSTVDSMADSEVRISMAISYATKALRYSELRPKQDLAVKHFLCGHDVFVLLPTQSGKSLCYCLLPKAFDFLWQRIESTQSIVVVVTGESLDCTYAGSSAGHERAWNNGSLRSRYARDDDGRDGIRSLPSVGSTSGEHLIHKSVKQTW